jgi:hypothetical protein
MRQVQAILMLPDFCWMTFAEVLAYIEQLSDDADYFSLGPLLTYLVRRGDIERKRSINLERNKGPINIYMYKRVTASASAASDTAPGSG